METTNETECEKQNENWVHVRVDGDNVVQNLRNVHP